MSHEKRRVNLERIRSDAKNQRAAVQTSIRAAAEPLLQLPETIELLRIQGRDEDIKKVEVLAKTVARDVDKFSEEFKAVNDSLEELETTPVKPKHLSRRFSEYMDHGLRFLTLNERVLCTAVKSADQISEIVMKNKESSSEGTENV